MENTIENTTGAGAIAAQYRTIDIDREEYRRLNALSGRGRSIPRGSYGGGDSYSVTISLASGAVIDLFHWFDPSF
jgi:hypothetical protein